MTAWVTLMGDMGLEPWERLEVVEKAGEVEELRAKWIEGKRPKSKTPAQDGGGKKKRKTAQGTEVVDVGAGLMDVPDKPARINKRKEG